MTDHLRSDTPTPPEAGLPRAAPGWLESMSEKLVEAAMALSAATSSDEVMRLAVVLGREKFGFSRIGCWFFEEGGASAVGAYGVDAAGRLSDERDLRIFDRTGFIRRMREAWSAPPYFFSKPRDILRSAEAKAVGFGAHVTAPLLRDGECCGFMAVDDLIPSASVNDKTGYLLCHYAALVASCHWEKRADERRRVAEEGRDQAELVKSEFLGMMSHEIRTPLNAIMGYAQLLSMKPSPDNTATLARSIEQSGDHLAELINGILEYAQLSGVDLKRWYQPSDPVAIAASVVAEWEPSYRARGVALEFTHEGHLDHPVQMDPLSFRQICSNLLQNALKFTREGRVRLALQTSEKDEERTECFLSVEDTGIGIEQDRLEEIFKPFKQLDSSLTRTAEGIGMGLAIVERLVSGMDGRLECQSVPGAGTTFAIDFLFQAAGSAGVSGSPSPELRTPRAVVCRKNETRLMLVEPSRQNHGVIQSMLKHLGYPAAEAAETAEDAMELLRRKPYDLVLLDVELPSMDGLALTREIRAGRVGPINRDVFILGLTAFVLEHDREQCLIAGMNDYLPKPARLAQLERALSRVFG